VEFSVTVHNPTELDKLCDETSLDMGFIIPARVQDGSFKHFGYPTNVYIVDGVMSHFELNAKQLTLEEVLSKYPKQSKEA